VDLIDLPFIFFLTIERRIVMNIVSVVKNASKPAVRFWNKHDSTILTGVTLIASTAAVVFALRDGPKCERILREKKEEGATTMETAKAVLPAASRTMMALAVAWGSAILNHKRTGEKIGSLVEALALTQSLRSEEKKKMIEEVGEEKVKKVEEEVVKERALAKSPTMIDQIQVTGHGNFIFREPMSGATFRGSKDYVELVIEKWSNRLKNAYENHNDEYEVSMSDIFDDIGVKMKIGFADLFVWRAADNDGDGIILNLNNTFEFEHDDGSTEPAYILDFYTKPILGYSSYTAPSGRYY
jgi:hypothetical protein